MPPTGSASCGIGPPALTDGILVDTARLKELIELMDRNNLEELEVVEGETRIRLRKKPDRGPEVVSMTHACRRCRWLEKLLPLHRSDPGEPNVGEAHPETVVDETRTVTVADGGYLLPISPGPDDGSVC